ncbi:hypothetical protein [Actinocorallia libanotica]|uniref:Uncharacterized protein n=1 Tax=Actinocorallia libanotica TaxID=46162 RepID=A0ABN1RU72_9ACTN
MTGQGNDRLLIDLDDQGRVSVSWQGGDQPELIVEHAETVWPLDADALEDLRWYLEDYLRAPFAVYSDRGQAIAAKIPQWGETIFHALFATGPALAAYVAVRASGNRPELVCRATAGVALGANP